MMTSLGAVRTIPVLVGDVFQQGPRRLVVTSFDGARSVCADVDTRGFRMTRIATRRLQREYSRCSEVDAAAAHRMLSKAQAAKAAQ